MLAELAAGRTTEWRAVIVSREASVLPVEQRRIVDARISPVLESSGDRQVEAATRVIAQTLDPEAAVRRARRAAADRRVSIRPVADAMARLSILTPLAQGVAAYAALTAAADTATATPGGEPRGRGQLMADTAIERITGQTRAADVPVTVNLVMPVDSLFARAGEAGRTTPAVLLGAAGPVPVPAGAARDLALAGDAPRWVRRLFTAPAAGRLLQLETHARCFTDGQREFLTLRDQRCRTPWCDAPVRHADHVQRHADGGTTSIANGRGLCAACNQAAAAPGWHSRVGPDGSVISVTPTGHTYLSPEPRPPGPLPAVVERQVDVGPIELVHFRHAS